ncbi:MAG: hypothetical protein LUO89_02095 [Methanothrix sp.]|nr:hypothetical protein [Methanothrix sp.]
MKIEGKDFFRETIHLDFSDLVNCTFTDCTLIYHGFGPVGMVGCSFNNVKWSFFDAATNTITFLAGLYVGAGPGGKNLIENVFEDIRSGKPIRKPSN